MAGVLTNSRGTTVMIDPALRDFDRPILVDAVPYIDAALVTHSDH